MDERTVTLKPLKVGLYSRAIILPRWWLKLNGCPDELSVTLSMGEIVIRPEATKENGDGGREAWK